MPRSVEIAHYSELIASLVVTAARTDSRERLSAIRAELTEALADIFTLLSHDALGPDLASALAARVSGWPAVEVSG